MSFPNRISLIFFVCAVQFCAPALAESPLNAKVIDAWIQSQAALEAWGKEHDEQLESAEIESHTPQSPLDMSAKSIIQPLIAAGLYDSANNIVRKYQFKNLEEWADITLRITMAAAAIELESNAGAMDTSELEALQNSPQLSSQQKELINQAISQNKAISKQLVEKSNPDDKQAVQPFLNRIHNLMNTPY